MMGFKLIVTNHVIKYKYTCQKLNDIMDYKNMYLCLSPSLFSWLDLCYFTLILCLTDEPRDELL